jgi:hypothetical protein
VGGQVSVVVIMNCRFGAEDCKGWEIGFISFNMFARCICTSGVVETRFRPEVSVAYACVRSVLRSAPLSPRCGGVLTRLYCAKHRDGETMSSEQLGTSE